MGNFEGIPTNIKGLAVIKAKVYGDTRGNFMEMWDKEEFEALGLNLRWSIFNRSVSPKGTFRGLHFQKQYPQGKLIIAMHGAVYDIAVDIRPDSPSFGQHYAITLTDEVADGYRTLFYVPPGLAHGFLALTDQAIFTYFVTDNSYHPDDEGGLLYKDPELGIKLPLAKHGLTEGDLIINDRDKGWPLLKQLK